MGSARHLRQSSHREGCSLGADALFGCSPVAVRVHVARSKAVTLRALLTGASGFVGTAVGMALREAGLDVVQVSRKPREQKNGTVLVGDLGDSNFVDSCVDGADVIVHCAGRTGAGGHELFDVNRDMAFSLARAARKHGVRHFIHVSSTGVFGVCSAALVQGEDSPCDPANDYERSKFEGERAVLGEADRAMFVTVVRPSNVFGEHHPWQKLLTWFASVQRGRILLAGDLESQWVNYVYVGDVSRSIAELARRGPAADAN